MVFYGFSVASPKRIIIHHQSLYLRPVLRLHGPSLATFCLTPNMPCKDKAGCESPCMFLVVKSGEAVTPSSGFRTLSQPIMLRQGRRPGATPGYRMDSCSFTLTKPRIAGMFSGVPSFVQGFRAESAGRTRCPVLGTPGNKTVGGSPALVPSGASGELFSPPVVGNVSQGK